MWYNDLKLGSRQWIAFGAILFMMASVSTFALNRMNRVKSQIDAINETWIPVLSSFSEINLDVSTFRNFYLEEILSDDVQNEQLWFDKMYPLIDSIENNQDYIEQTIDSSLQDSPIGSELNEGYDLFREYWNDYLGATLTRFDGRDWSSDEKLRMFKETGPLYDSLNASLEEVIEINKQAAAAAALEGLRSYNQTRRVVVSSFILTLLLSSLIAIMLVQSITGPVSELENAAEAIANGDLDVKIAVESKDEIGNLAESFNTMTASLQEARRQNEAQSEELIEQQRHLKASNEQLESRNEDLEQTMRRLQSAQEQLVIKEKMASLGQLTAGIAHEIKNPLNFVNNFAFLSIELMKELVQELEDNKDKKVSEMLEEITALVDDLEFNATKINEHGKRADGIVRSMLLHSRGRSGEREEVSLNTFLDEYVNLAYHGMRASNPEFMIRINRSFDPDVHTTKLVPQDMGRVFINLLNNAFYAAWQRAKETGAQAEISIITSRKKEGIYIQVRDNGGGIPEGLQKKIFEPFFTTKPTGQGTGLGLSLSYDIVTLGHRGKMFVESEEGVGATFTIVLPEK